MDGEFELLLMRHGQAEDDAPGGDARRALTPVGRAQARAVGTALQRLDLIPDRALSSPFVRACQTLAELQLTAMPGDIAPPDPRLAPSASPDVMLQALSETAAALSESLAAHPGPARPPRVLAVGHNPCIGAALRLLAGIPFNVSTGDFAHLYIWRRGSDVRATMAGYYPVTALQRLIHDS